MVCNKCNHKLPDDSAFCQYCGNKITVAETKNVSVPVTPVKTTKQNNKERSANEKMSISLAKHSIPCVLIPFFLLVICLNTKSVSSHTEMLYIIPMIICLVLSALLIINSKKSTSSVALINIPWLLSVGAIIPFLAEDIWKDGDYKDAIAVMLIISALFFILNIVIQLYFAITLDIKKYHATASYKIKCYEKILY